MWSLTGIDSIVAAVKSVSYFIFSVKSYYYGQLFPVWKDILPQDILAHDIV